MDKNIRENKEAMQELIGMGYQSTPVTLIDGEEIVGFDQARIEKLLGI